MADCADDLVPPGDDVLPVEQHDRFVEHLAAFHADVRRSRHDRSAEVSPAGSCGSPRRRSPRSCVATRSPDRSPPPDLGWRQVPDRSPRLNALVRAGARRPRAPRRRAGHHPADLRRRGLEARQPRLACRRAHRRTRLGLSGRSAAVLGAGLVPGAQPLPHAPIQGGDDRRLPSRPRGVTASTRRRGGTGSSASAWSG